MKRVLNFELIWVLFLMFCLGIIFQVRAEEISLPSELKAKAWVLKKEENKLWEKTLVVKFNSERKVLSTNDGYRFVYLVINHSAHPEIWKKVCVEKKTEKEVGGKIYANEIKHEIAQTFNVDENKVAMMATAADMDNLAVVTETFTTSNGTKLVVTALVTAGAESNALRTGLDKGRYLEGELVDPGTVNILLLTNVILTEPALARAIITITEAKTAAFQDLKVPSSYTKEVIATGTGTDSVIVVSGTDLPIVTYAGGHSKIGELIGKAVYKAVKIALCKQNGFCE